MGRKRIDLTGKRFGRLIAIEYVIGGRWVCKCDCGNEITAITNNLTRGGHTTSCGCFRLERAIEASKTHGMSSHPLYLVYDGIMSRCLNKKNKRHKDYGGRGITVCDEWAEDKVKFFDWAQANGYEKGLEIDRRNNDGNYEPSNCRFVTPRENSLNRRKRSDNKSSYVGVSKSSNRDLYISTLGSKYLGCSKTIRQALDVRNNFIKENKLEREYKIQEWRN